MKIRKFQNLISCSGGVSGYRFIFDDDGIPSFVDVSKCLFEITDGTFRVCSHKFIEQMKAIDEYMKNNPNFENTI